MSCILHISGVRFDVDAFVTKSKVRPYKVFYKGEARLKTKPKGPKHARSGLSMDVSKAGMNDFNGQVKDAIRFLTRNREKLRYITKTKEIRYAVLVFGVDQKIDGNEILMANYLLPVKLLRLAGDLGISIELTLYAENMQTVLEKRISLLP